MIEIKHLTVAFKQGKPVVENLSLTVPDKLRTVVIGESGSGKSIMLSAILRLLPPEARVSGQILIDRQTDMLKLSERELEKVRGLKLAYIPQGSGNSLNPLLTVGFQVAEPMMTFKGMKKEHALLSAVEGMKKLRLGNEETLAQAYPHTLSGGMRQRVLIAMGMAAGAEVVLADEPTKGLDRERIAAVVEMLDRMENRTLLCVSHDLRFASAIADRICVMHQAKQVEYCSRNEFFESPLHPYSRMMLAALPENGLCCGSSMAGVMPTEGYAAEGHAAEDYVVKGHAAEDHTMAGHVAEVVPMSVNMDVHGQMTYTVGCPFYGWCPERMAVCHTPPPMVEIGERKVRCHLYADSCGKCDT